MAGILGVKKGLGWLTRSHHVNMPGFEPKFSVSESVLAGQQF